MYDSDFNFGITSPFKSSSNSNSMSTYRPSSRTSRSPIRSQMRSPREMLSENDDLIGKKVTIKDGVVKKNIIFSGQRGVIVGQTKNKMNIVRMSDGKEYNFFGKDIVEIGPYVRRSKNSKRLPKVSSPNTLDVERKAMSFLSQFDGLYKDKVINYICRQKTKAYRNRKRSKPMPIRYDEIGSRDMSSMRSRRISKMKSPPPRIIEEDYEEPEEIEEDIEEFNEPEDDEMEF